MKIKLHLNEKIWFGKYKNNRLVDIINSYPKYIKLMLSEHDVELDESSLEYYKNHMGNPIDKPISRRSIDEFRTRFVSVRDNGELGTW